MFKITALGNLVSDARTGENNGKTVVNFTIAAHTMFKDAEKNYITNYIDVSVWNNQAQSCSKLKKGNKVCVVGSAVVKPYTTKDGKSGFNIVVSPDNVEFCTLPPREETDDIFNS